MVIRGERERSGVLVLFKDYYEKPKWDEYFVVSSHFIMLTSPLVARIGKLFELKKPLDDELADKLRRLNELLEENTYLHDAI